MYLFMACTRHESVVVLLNSMNSLKDTCELMLELTDSFMVGDL